MYLPVLQYNFTLQGVNKTEVLGILLTQYLSQCTFKKITYGNSFTITQQDACNIEVSTSAGSKI